MSRKPNLTVAQVSNGGKCQRYGNVRVVSEYSLIYVSQVSPIFTKSWSESLALKAVGLVTFLKFYLYKPEGRGFDSR
jgi:hypothetical protein